MQKAMGYISLTLERVICIWVYMPALGKGSSKREAISRYAEAQLILSHSAQDLGDDPFHYEAALSAQPIALPQDHRVLLFQIATSLVSPGGERTGMGR
jgi:hypothetical protein